MEKCSHIENPKNIRYLKQFREKFLGSIEGESLKEMRLSFAKRKGYKNYSEYQKRNSFVDYIDENHELDPEGYAESYMMF